MEAATSSTTVRHVTVCGPFEAAWFVEEGVVHVIWIGAPDTRTDLPGCPALGECYPGPMPRRLWERVRFEFERDRPRFTVCPG